MVIKKRQIFNGLWFKPKRYQACCDCGLVHMVEFKIKNGVVLQRVFTKKRITAIIRKKYFKNYVPSNKVQTRRTGKND